MSEEKRLPFAGYPDCKSALIPSVVLSFDRTIAGTDVGDWKLETRDTAQTGPRVSKHEYLS